MLLSTTKIENLLMAFPNSTSGVVITSTDNKADHRLETMKC